MRAGDVQELSVHYQHQHVHTQVGAQKLEAAVNTLLTAVISSFFTAKSMIARDVEQGFFNRQFRDQTLPFVMLLHSSPSSHAFLNPFLYDPVQLGHIISNLRRCSSFHQGAIHDTYLLQCL